MDVCDIGSEIEQMQREQALARTRAGQTPAGESAQWCKEPGCGARIPEARRRAVPGVRLCIDCATSHEQRATNHEQRKRAGV